MHFLRRRPFCSLDGLAGRDAALQGLEGRQFKGD